MKPELHRRWSAALFYACELALVGCVATPASASELPRRAAMSRIRSAPPAIPARVRLVVLHTLGGPDYGHPERRWSFLTPRETLALWQRPSFGAHWIIWIDGSIWPRRPAAGYRSEKNLLHLERTGIDGFVALGREKKDSPPTSNSKLEATLRMKAKLKTKRGRKWYKRRKLGEPPFGWIKAVLGFQSFSLRGLEKTSAEWNLVCLALNLRRLNRKMVWV